MKTRIIYVDDSKDSCPADALMADFRKKLSASTYAKRIEFSQTCIDFFKEMADIVDETEDNLRFRWYEVPEQDLPPLELKIRCKEGRYMLMYLNEYGDEPTVIKGKQSKGKNRGVAESLIIIKGKPQLNTVINEENLEKGEEK